MKRSCLLLSSSVVAIVEELLARDLVVLHRIDTYLFQGDSLAAGFWGDIEREADSELIGCLTVEERAGHCLAVEGFVGDPVLGFLDHRTLTDGLLAVAFN